jgi:hypothetical protein
MACSRRERIEKMVICGKRPGKSTKWLKYRRTCIHQDDQAFKPEVPKIESSLFCRSWFSSMWLVQAGTDLYALRIESASGHG